MGTLNPDTVDALNMLLEDVRASVEVEVALSNGATEYLEREALTSMGVEDTLIAFLLRDWMESLDLPITRRINGIVLQALDLTRYDDRLTLFVRHQLASREEAERLLDEAGLDADGQEILRSIVDAHTRHAVWCEQRAREFAETRELDFRRPSESGQGLGRSPSLPDGPDIPDIPDIPDTHDLPDDTPPDVSDDHDPPRTAARTLPEPGIDGAVTEPNGPPVE